MVSFRLSYRRYFIGKLHRFDEIPERELPRETESVGSDLPTRRLYEERSRLVAHKRKRTPFTRYTVFLLKLRHRKTLPCAYDGSMDALLYRIRTILGTLLDTVVPRRPRRVRAETRTHEELRIAPESHTMLGVEITTLAHYTDVRDLIQSLKYDRSSESAHLLALALAEYLHEDIASRKLLTTKPVLLIPMPLDAKRRRDRGFNQIGMVVDALPVEFKNGELARIAAPLLERTRATRTQTKLTRAERLSNVDGAFAVSDASLLEGMLVYLIDDVATTGATLVNASKPLELAGADVTRLALARA